MGDILIGNPVDHPGIVRVEKLDELFRCGREANGQQNIQFIDDRQHLSSTYKCNFLGADNKQ